MKTSELTGVNLDLAVALCNGIVDKWFDSGHLTVNGEIYSPSTDWSQGGPIIEREGIAIDCIRCGVNIDSWQAGSITAGDDNWDSGVQYGPTPLIAAMRCYVSSKLGDEVEIPEGLKCEQ